MIAVQGSRSQGLPEELHSKNTEFALGHAEKGYRL